MNRLYRMIERITFADGRPSLEMGAVSRLKGISKKGIKILLKKGAIAPVSSPPLSILPGWEERAKLLASVGVMNIEDLLTSDLGEIARRLNISPGGLRQAANEAKRWVEA